MDVKTDTLRTIEIKNYISKSNRISVRPNRKSRKVAGATAFLRNNFLTFNDSLQQNFTNKL